MSKLILRLFLPIFSLSFGSSIFAEENLKYQSFIDKGNFQLPIAPQAMDFPETKPQIPEKIPALETQAAMPALKKAPADISKKPEPSLADELDQIFAEIEGLENAEPKQPIMAQKPLKPKTQRKKIDRQNDGFLDEAEDIWAEHKFAIDEVDDLPLIEIPDKITAGALIDKSKIYRNYSSSKIRNDKMNRKAPFYRRDNETKAPEVRTEIIVKEIPKTEQSISPGSHEIEFIAGTNPILRKVEKIEAIPEVQIQSKQDIIPESLEINPKTLASAKVGSGAADAPPTTSDNHPQTSDSHPGLDPGSNPKKKKLSPESFKFVRNELIFILLNDDNVILGQQTEESRLDQMSFGEYARHFESQNREGIRTKEAKRMESFIAKHQTRPKRKISKGRLLKMVTKAIDDDDLNYLRVLDDNYNIIHLEDVDDSNILHMAIAKDKPEIAKWLVMRGVDINAINEELMAPIDIAALKGKIGIFNMLKKAGAR